MNESANCNDIANPISQENDGNNQEMGNNQYNSGEKVEVRIGNSLPNVARLSIPNENSNSDQNEAQNENNVIEDQSVEQNEDIVEDIDEDVLDSESESEKQTKDSEDFIDPKEYLTMKPVYYYTITAITYIFIVLLSIVVGDIQIFLKIIGTWGSSWAIWGGPGSFYIIMVHKKSVPFKTPLDYVLYAFGWIYILIALGVLFGWGTWVILDALE